MMGSIDTVAHGSVAVTIEKSLDGKNKTRGGPFRVTQALESSNGRSSVAFFPHFIWSKPSSLMSATAADGKYIETLFCAIKLSSKPKCSQCRRSHNKAISKRSSVRVQLEQCEQLDWRQRSDGSRAHCRRPKETYSAREGSEDSKHQQCRPWKEIEGAPKETEEEGRERQYNSR